MTSHMQKADNKVFIVDKTASSTTTSSPSDGPDHPQVKHFKPKVLQGQTPERIIIPLTKRGADLFCAKRRKPDKTPKFADENGVGKENINIMNQQPKFVLGKSKGAFTKLNLLLEVVSKMEPKMGSKIQNKVIRKRALMDSQEPNLVIP